MTDVRAVALNEKILFRCRLCGDCCRNVKDSVMLEPIDAYRLARYLRERGEPVFGTEDVLANYAHASWLENRFPIFLLNTVGTMDACVFLKEGRCSIYEARPHVCRMYPFSVAPGERGRDFRYFLCTEKSHHFADGMVTVKSWLSENFVREAKEALKADYDAIPVLGRPFLPQFLSNLEQLKKLTGG